MMPAKLPTPCLFKVKVFWNKGYDFIVSVDDAIKKILSRDSYYFVDVVMWPMFDSSNISMREVIITLIL